MTEPMRVEGATPFRAMSVGKSGVLAIGRDGITYLYSWDSRSTIRDFQKVVPKVLDSQIRFATIDARGALSLRRPIKLALDIAGVTFAPILVPDLK